MVRSLLGHGIRAIDWILRRAYKVRPFCDDRACILRISPGRVRRALRLSDGASLRPGDPLVNIHLWNERLDDLGLDVPAAWGAVTLHRFRFSLGRLAALLTDGGEWREVVAVCGELSFVTGLEKARRFFEPLGFDLFLVDQPGLKIWRPAFWDNLFASWLMWTFNPASLRGKRLGQLVRVEVWMSRDTLLRKYAPRG
jgi:hypothetical protein